METTSPRIAMVFGSGGLGDRGYYNQMGVTGLEMARAQFGISFDYRLPNSVSDFKPYLQEFASSGTYELVCVMSFGASDALRAVASTFPAQKFAAFDARADLPNVSNYGGDPRSAAFLAGGVGARSSSTGMLATLFGTENPGYWTWVASFIAGAKFAVPNVEVVPSFLPSWSPSPAEGEAAADDLYLRGIDVIMAHLDEGDLGVFSAARKHGRYAIGFNGERALDPARILFDVCRHLEVLVYDAVERMVTGSLRAGLEISGMEAGQYALEFGEPTHPCITKQTVDHIERLKQLLTDERLKGLPSALDEIAPFLEATSDVKGIGIGTSSDI